ncbi:MAG: GAF domain-containing protein, partial [Comamonadaceae bacterium]
MIDLPPEPADEEQRLVELRLFSVLDTEPDEEYDRLVELASIVCGTPMATLTFVDADRQWHKARVGVPLSETPRRLSLCAHAILDSNRFVEIGDTSSVQWFDPFIYGKERLPVGFYAAMPLKTRDGSAIGTLCVMDHTPRALT